nr:MAG TPA: hypothetical protein [Caudoviricetes sp.]
MAVLSASRNSHPVHFEYRSFVSRNHHGSVKPVCLRLSSFHIFHDGPYGLPEFFHISVPGLFFCV